MPIKKNSQQKPAKKTERGKLPDAAKRALAEAEERRGSKQNDQKSEGLKKVREINGRKGLEPTRYGDWEKKGIAVDF